MLNQIYADRTAVIFIATRQFAAAFYQGTRYTRGTADGRIV